jgi:hypothetical protein
MGTYCLLCLVHGTLLLAQLEGTFRSLTWLVWSQTFQLCNWRTEERYIFSVLLLVAALVVAALVGGGFYLI